jgi:hypothetical protein
MAPQSLTAWDLPPAWGTTALAAGLFAAGLLAAFLLARRKAGPPAAERPPDRRKERRRPGRPVSVLVTDADGAVDAQRGYLADYTADGVGLILLAQVPAGATLSLLPGDAPLETPRVRAEVRYCHRHPGGGYMVGCHFREPPPGSVLAHFGE